MTPAARLEAARTVLAQWLDGRPAEQALSQWARGARYAGSKDRRAVRDHVYDVLRQKGVCEELGEGGDARSLIIGLARLSGWPSALFSGEGYGPDGLSAQEARLFAEPVEFDRHNDTPPWLLQKLQSQHENWTGIAEMLARRAPVFLRVNLARGSREEARSSLSRDGIEVALPDCPTALEVVAGEPRLRTCAAYTSGLVEPQDLSVQCALAAIDWPRGGRILDYCAGGGGKALAIAAVTHEPVHIHDADPRRMRDAYGRATRAGAVLQGVDTPLGPYDLVLTDVPCSGSGTWRRDPEAKWRLDNDRLATLIQSQIDILDAASILTKRIVYMTCSLLAEENQMQIEGFLKRHAGWNLHLEQRFTSIDASDGFYVAEIRFGEN